MDSSLGAVVRRVRMARASATSTALAASMTALRPSLRRAAVRLSRRSRCSSGGRTPAFVRSMASRHTSGWLDPGRPAVAGQQLHRGQVPERAVGTDDKSQRVGVARRHSTRSPARNHIGAAEHFEPLAEVINECVHRCRDAVKYGTTLAVGVVLDRWEHKQPRPHVGPRDRPQVLLALVSASPDGFACLTDGFAEPRQRTLSACDRRGFEHPTGAFVIGGRARQDERARHTTIDQPTRPEQLGAHVHAVAQHDHDEPVRSVGHHGRSRLLHVQTVMGACVRPPPSMLRLRRRRARRNTASTTPASGARGSPRTIERPKRADIEQARRSRRLRYEQ